MLSKFIAEVEARREKEAAIIEKATKELDRRREFNKEISAELDAIGQTVPGFDNDDPAI